MKNLSFFVILVMGPSRSPKYVLEGVRLALTQM